MKDLVLKKKTELEEHKRRAHLIGEDDCEVEFPVEAIEAGKNSLKICHVLVTPCKCIVKHFCCDFLANHFYYFSVQYMLENI